jgi:hypothetical protein
MMVCTAVFVAVSSWWAFLYPALWKDIPRAVSTLSSHTFEKKCDKRYHLVVQVGDRDVIAWKAKP